MTFIHFHRGRWRFFFFVCRSTHGLHLSHYFLGQVPTGTQIPDDTIDPHRRLTPPTGQREPIRKTCKTFTAPMDGLKISFPRIFMKHLSDSEFEVYIMKWLVDFSSTIPLLLPDVTSTRTLTQMGWVLDQWGASVRVEIRIFFQFFLLLIFFSIFQFFNFLIF